MTRSRFAALVTALSAALLSCQSRPAIGPGADHVFIDARIYTVDPSRPWAAAVAVEGERISYVGDEAGARALIGSATEVHDLGGRLLLPGFIDTHAHPIMAAGSRENLSLDPRWSEVQVLRAVARYARKHRDARLIQGFGFGATQFGAEGPDRRALDRVVTDRPVLLVDEGGHSAWANSKTFEVLGIDRDTPDPIPGSHFYKRDANGNPTGWMLESQTFMPALAAMGGFSARDAVAGADDLFGLFSSVGVTTVYDAGMTAFEGMGFEALAQLDAEGRLPLRYVASHMIQNPNQLAAAIESFRDLEARYRGKRLRVGGIKLHNDGTIEAHTAGLLRPYTDDPDNRGGILVEGAALREFVTNVDAAGIDLHIHAIGDRTIREALDAVASARRSNGATGTRITLCHLELIHADDMHRFAELDVIAQTTPIWHGSGGPDSVPALGAERAHAMFRFNSLVREDVRVTFGSDFPASGTILGISPVHNIEIGHTRQTTGEPDSRLQGRTQDRLALETLVRGYTLDAAFQLRMEDEVGSIEVGKRADLIVLSRNLFEVDPYAIHSSKVLLTMLDGVVVHERGPRNWLTDFLLGL
ncbi:MAG: amidohydrolase [Deltaproteobacteria bacterium]|nr:amidohydrolase [Deltaproteobacteria bacterium]